MGYLTKDGRLAAGYVVNTTLPLRYFSFLPDQERGQLPREPAEGDFAEITCIWIDPDLVGYFDRGVVSHAHHPKAGQYLGCLDSGQVLLGAWQLSHARQLCILSGCLGAGCWMCCTAAVFEQHAYGCEAQGLTSCAWGSPASPTN